MKRSPVLLLTGALGSGKTTLLAAWLRQPPLRNAALVVNEIGEVGFDDRLLLPMMQASEGAALLANACICCTGLPGLGEAMQELYRARLERRIARFDTVVVETTGLAEPHPVRALLAQDAVLREHFALAGVITAVSATAPGAWRLRAEWQAQVRDADLLVITKADRVDAQALQGLEQELRKLRPGVPVLRSAQGSVAAAEALANLPAPAEDGSAPGAAQEPAQQEPAHHHHEPHRHDAHAQFVPMPAPLPRSVLARRLQRCITAGGARLLRMKGVVQAEDGLPVAVQWAAGDAEATLAPFAGTPARAGLTLIVTQPAAADEIARLLDR
jgi:G3E family GTPase